MREVIYARFVPVHQGPDASIDINFKVNGPIVKYKIKECHNGKEYTLTEEELSQNCTAKELLDVFEKGNAYLQAMQDRFNEESLKKEEKIVSIIDNMAFEALPPCQGKGWVRIAK